MKSFLRKPLKVPLEKMNTKSDLYKWSEDLFIKETSKNCSRGTQDKLDLWRDKICKVLDNLQEGSLWKCIFV